VFLQRGVCCLRCNETDATVCEAARTESCLCPPEAETLRHQSGLVQLSSGQGPLPRSTGKAAVSTLQTRTMQEFLYLLQNRLMHNSISATGRRTWRPPCSKVAGAHLAVQRQNRLLHAAQDRPAIGCRWRHAEQNRVPAGQRPRNAYPARRLPQVRALLASFAFSQLIGGLPCNAAIACNHRPASITFWCRCRSSPKGAAVSRILPGDHMHSGDDLCL